MNGLGLPQLKSIRSDIDANLFPVHFASNLLVDPDDDDPRVPGPPSH